jgi:archaellum component FlaG (FlaF/FlaG flagellin family)
MRAPTPSHPRVTPEIIALSDSKKTEKLADSLEAHFQPVNDPSEPAVIAMADKALQA